MECPTTPAGPAVLDALHLGLRAAYDLRRPLPADAFRRGLAGLGVLVSGSDPLRVTLRLVAPGWERAPCRAELALSVDGTRLSVTGASLVGLNPLRAVREQHPGHALGPAALDGGTNTVGPTAGREGVLLPLQLAYVAAVADLLAGALAAATEGASTLEAPVAWLRAAEACADVSDPDPCLRAWDLFRSAPPGARRSTHSAYSARHLDFDGLVPAIRFVREGEHFTLKAYAKAAGAAGGTVRAEVDANSRDQVREVIGDAEAGPVPLGGAEVAGMALAFAEAAGHHLGDLVNFVRSAPRRPRWRVAAALQPLLDLATGRPAENGAKPGPKSVAAARRCYEALMEVGWCQASNFDKESAIVQRLEKIAAEGHLVRVGIRRRYVLHW